jgi:hypothetical protein
MENNPPVRSLPAWIFLSPTERRLRSGYRLLGFFLVFTSLLYLANFSLFGLQALNLPNTDLLIFLGNSLFPLIAVIGAVWIARRFFDHRSFGSLGLRINRQMVYDLIAGLLITAVIMELVFLLMRSQHWLTIDSYAWNFVPWSLILFQAAVMLIIWITLAWQEELLLRGYIMQNLATGLNMLVAVLLTSALFGLTRLSNLENSWLAVTGGFAAGLFYAYAYLRTRSLWLPVGLHIGWNFFEGTIFGFPVGGTSDFSLIQLSIQGPELITGGFFGPDAGLIVLPALLLGAGLIYIYTRGRAMFSKAEILHWSFDDRELTDEEAGFAIEDTEGEPNEGESVAPDESTGEVDTPGDDETAEAASQPSGEDAKS